MSQRFDEEDLMYELEEAEGASDLYDDEYEEEYDDEYDEMEDYFEDEYEEEDEYDEMEDYFEDEYEEEDELFDLDDYADEYGYEEAEEEAEEELEDMMAYALGAEDTDEFFKSLWRGIKKVGRGVFRGIKKAAPIIGKIARTAAPIAGMIPGWGTLASAGLGLLGQLRAEGATDEEALEAFAELAAKNPKARPIVAGLAARVIAPKSKLARSRLATRKKIVKDMKTAIKILTAKRGKGAVRAIVPIAKSIKRTAAVRRTPVAVRAKIAKKTALKIARSPKLTRKYARPKLKAKRMVKKAIIKAVRKKRI